MNPVLKKRALLVIDVFLIPAVYWAAWLLKLVRIADVRRMPFCKATLMRVGVFPIRDHYYEPLFDGKHLRFPLNQDRDLPGIDWNVEGQLQLLGSFNSGEELRDSVDGNSGELSFDIANDAFSGGDADFFYNLIRCKKPKRIFEIGSGNSTLIAIKALKKNQEEDAGYQCSHLCIEPFEMPWLEKTGAAIVRKKVEEMDVTLFKELESNDILFIDSSHIIRPQGDVLFEFLELIPLLNEGVIVHVHDIFSPKDYLKEWVVDRVSFWNEQYLLEAFLTCNDEWKIIGALNYLKHNHYSLLKSKSILLTPAHEPGSFYIQKSYPEIKMGCAPPRGT